MTALAADDVTTEVAEVVQSTHTDTVPSGRPVVDLVDVRDRSSGCLKRHYSSHNKKSNVKKQKMSEKASSSVAAAASQLTVDDEAVVVSSSLSSDGNRSADSSSVENREDRCLLNTSTGV